MLRTMKMAWMILTLAFVLCSCTPPKSAPTSTPEELKAADSSISGGDGSSPEQAIVLAETTPAVIRQEYALFRALRGTAPAGQGLLEKDGRHYDVMVGEDGKALYFDITAYWRNTYDN